MVFFQIIILPDFVRPTVEVILKVPVQYSKLKRQMTIRTTVEVYKFRFKDDNS